MSTLIPTASGAPAARTESTAASRASLPLAITATRAPSAASVWAMASPMPLLPPVTTAVAPANPRSIALPSVSRRDTDSAQAEADDLVADGNSIAISGRPLPFDTRPYRAVNRQRIGGRGDIGENAGAHSTLELLDKRFQDLAVGVAHQLRRCEHLSLRFERHLA